MLKKRFNFKPNIKWYSPGIRIITLILVLTVALSAYGASEDDYEQRIKEEQKRLKQMEEEMKRVKDEVAKLQKEEKGYLEALNNLEKLLAKTEKELQTVEQDLKSLTQEIKQVEKEFATEKKTLEEKTKLLELKLREIYKHNRAGQLAILLSSETLTEFLTRYRYFGAILSQDKELIDSVLFQIKETEDKKKDLENRQEVLRLLQEEVKKEKENLDYSIKARKSLVGKIGSQKTAYLKSLEELEEASSEIKKLIDSIYQKQQEQQKSSSPQEKQSAETTLKPKKGIFSLPVQGKVISNFGRQLDPTFNTYIFNSGIDVSAPLGEAVRAAASGEVIYTGSIKGYGQIVIIDHGGRTTTLYAHLAKILVEMGDKVSKNQIIGQVGESGGVPSPRLHFEVRVEGEPTDPMNWL